MAWGSLVLRRIRAFRRMASQGRTASSRNGEGIATLVLGGEARPHHGGCLAMRDRFETARRRGAVRFLSCFAVFCCGSAVLAQTSAAVSSADKDKQFLEYLWQNNQAEIQLGINAQKLAQAPAVIAFARLIVSDNSDLKTQLEPVIRDTHVAVPVEMVQQRANMIAPKAGVDFDQAFLAS